MGKILENTRITYIYTLSCPVTKEVRYVGKTVNTKKRLSQHLSKAKKNPTTYRDNWIKSLLNKGNKPILKVVEKTIWRNSQQKEKLWISKYKNLVNHSLGGEGNLGMKFTKSHKKRISETKRKNAKNVYQFSLNGKFIKKYRSAVDAAEQLNLKASNICQVCRLGKKSHGGYIWSNTKDIDFKNYEHSIGKGNNTSNNNFVKSSKKITVTFESNIYYFNSIKEAAKFTSISRSTISRICKGIRKNDYDYKFKYTS